MSHSARSALLRLVAACASAAVIGSGLLTASAASAAPDWKSQNTSFVTREGTQLHLDGAPFSASGTNIYWLGLDENVGGVAFPTYFRIKDALDTAAQMGINVVRSHMMTSTGQDDANPLAIMPRIGEYNDEAFATIDFAIAYAGSLGIRLVLPLTDEWSYYHGGHRDFTTPLGLESADFYSDEAAIAAYEDYVDHILTRVNALTGVAYVDDPTIMAWELGNELEGMTLDWINREVAFISERAPKQLVAAGRRFDIDPDTLQAPDLDIVDVHYYPPTAEKVSADAAAVAAAGKVYIAGEYASTAATDSLLQPAAADPNVSGMFFWSLFGNNDLGGLVPHDDGFTLHYPGETDRMRQSVAAIEGYSRALNLQTGTLDVAQPLIVSIEQTNAINRVAWRGSAGATSYTVERSLDGDTWTAVTERPVSAEASPVTDLDSPSSAQYRVLAHPVAGGPVASDAVAASAGNVLIDPLADWSLTNAHGVAAIQPPTGAVATGTGAQASWKIAGIKTAQFLLTANDATTVSVSDDGQTWTDVAVERATVNGRPAVTVRELSNEYVRVAWPTGVTLERATISSASPRVALFDPLDDFARSHAHTGSLSFDTGNPALFGGDTSRLKRDAAGDESITWTYDDISGADLVAYYWPDQPVIPLTLSGSADGDTWTTLEPVIDAGAGNWRQYTYRLRDLVDTNFLRASWDGASGEAWSPQLSQLSLFSPNAPALGVPSDVTLTAPDDGTPDVRSMPVFSWLPSGDAAYYRFTLATNPALTAPVRVETGLTSTSFQPPMDLTPSTTYYWRVDAVNGLGSTSSAVRSFTSAATPTEPLVVEDFESYADDAALQKAYVRNSGGGTLTPTLAENPLTDTAAGLFTYDLGAPGYAGAVRTFDAPQSWFGYSGLGLSLQAPVGASVTVQFVAAGGYWETTIPVTSDGFERVELDFTEFSPPAWAGESRLNLSTVTELAFYIADAPVGSVLVDDVTALAPTVTEPEPPAPGVDTPGVDGGAGTDASTGALAGTGGTSPVGWLMIAGALLALGGAVRLITRKLARNRP